VFSALLVVIVLVDQDGTVCGGRVFNLQVSRESSWQTRLLNFPLV
jgi:hypothetical protein